MKVLQVGILTIIVERDEFFTACIIFYFSSYISLVFWTLKYLL